MLSTTLRRMTHPTALSRTRLVARHMSASATAEEPSVLFESRGSVRRYILNRPKKQNALDESMIDLLRPQLQEWEKSDLCRIVVGDGKGKAFCAGGDVQAVIHFAANEKTLPKATGYFKKEFELDYQLSTLQKPYVCILDGFTMGGGVGLSAHAPFRIATENTVFAMPETKIGYCPDVGASHFLPKLDGEMGTYLGLTGEFIKGRAVFEHGLATHYVPSRRLPALMGIMESMEESTLEQINAVIEEHYEDPLEGEKVGTILGEHRAALDTAFGHNTVEEIFESLRKMQEPMSGMIGEWAKTTLSTLELRCPTSLKVALEAVRRGRKLSLANALRMEMGIATAFLAGGSPDFATGVTKVLVEKDRNNRPPWNPNQLEEVSQELVNKFFDDSELVRAAPKLDIREAPETEERVKPMSFGLPTEEDIGRVVRGDHPQSGSLALTPNDLIQKFNSLTGNKKGVEKKVLDVIERRCERVADGDGKRYLRWK